MQLESSNDFETLNLSLFCNNKLHTLLILIRDRNIVFASVLLCVSRCETENTTLIFFFMSVH